MYNLILKILVRWTVGKDCQQYSIFNQNLIAEYGGKINRLRTEHGKCNFMLFRWNAIQLSRRACGMGETIKHIVDCPITKFGVSYDCIKMTSPCR